MPSPAPLAKALATLLLVLPVALPGHAQQIYKCVKDGKTAFQAAPCEEGATSTPQLRIVTSSGLPWEGLRLGRSSAADVQRVIPGTQAENSDTGAPARLRKPGVAVAGVTFNATYELNADGRLASVLLEKVGESMNMSSNDANLADYRKLTAALRAKYGAEAGSTMKNRETGFSGLSAGMEWNIEGGRLFVAVIPVTAVTSMLSVGYQPGQPPR